MLRLWDELGINDLDTPGMWRKKDLDKMETSLLPEGLGWSGGGVGANLH